MQWANEQRERDAIFVMPRYKTQINGSDFFPSEQKKWNVKSNILLCWLYFVRECIHILS